MNYIVREKSNFNKEGVWTSSFDGIHILNQIQRNSKINSATESIISQATTLTIHTYVIGHRALVTTSSIQEAATHNITGAARV